MADIELGEDWTLWFDPIWLSDVNNVKELEELEELEEYEINN